MIVLTGATSVTLALVPSQPLVLDWTLWTLSSGTRLLEKVMAALLFCPMEVHALVLMRIADLKTVLAAEQMSLAAPRPDNGLTTRSDNWLKMLTCTHNGKQINTAFFKKKKKKQCLFVFHYA
eukprot:Lithocolla_globosa_v1_NODE_3426_length_1673_cov_201.509271.p2 type:complete len:122 gc:universal NODE_3426_length_1673_cov_201.509271:483-118(-)